MSRASDSLFPYQVGTEVMTPDGRGSVQGFTMRSPVYRSTVDVRPFGGITKTYAMRELSKVVEK